MNHALLRVDAVPFRGEMDEAIPAAVRAGFDEALHCNGAWFETCHFQVTPESNRGRSPGNQAGVAA